ncbi:hypothetical protein ATE92_0121 [Ulvibacter sp. MAR_2010_11]|nr:hypothetical protein ATE92_0121 [Ulvibacter sp. MAR_2010_11]
MFVVNREILNGLIYLNMKDYLKLMQLTNSKPIPHNRNQSIYKILSETLSQQKNTLIKYLISI